jgi:hypothetical protein
MWKFLRNESLSSIYEVVRQPFSSLLLFFFINSQKQDPSEFDDFCSDDGNESTSTTAFDGLRTPDFDLSPALVLLITFLN